MNWSFYSASDFEMIKIRHVSNFQSEEIQRVRFWSEKNTTRHILIFKNYIASGFEKKKYKTCQILIKSHLSRKNSPGKATDCLEESL